MNDVGWLDIPLGLAVGAVDKRRGFEYTSLNVESWAGGCERTVKFTTYFGFIRRRPDRAIIQEEWIKRVISSPVREVVQKDGRIRRWAPIKEMDNRHLRVVLLSDRETVHNAFFDRRFKS